MTDHWMALFKRAGNVINWTVSFQMLTVQHTHARTHICDVCLCLAKLLLTTSVLPLRGF